MFAPLGWFHPEQVQPKREDLPGLGGWNEEHSLFL